MMNRNASYVALTRHREGLRVYSDRETFDNREHLDRALSRAPSTAGRGLPRRVCHAASHLRTSL